MLLRPCLSGLPWVLLASTSCCPGGGAFSRGYILGLRKEEIPSSMSGMSFPPSTGKALDWPGNGAAAALLW